MDPLGMTWGGRDRPAGSWCTREEEMGEGSYRGTIADPPANRKAEAGGPEGGMVPWGETAGQPADRRAGIGGPWVRPGVNCRRR